MNTFFNTVHITNFKSLKDVTLSDCKRINLLIGKPNVGKSNILEAIGLFSLPYFNINGITKLTDYIRLESFEEIFFDGNIKEKIIIKTDDGRHCIVTYQDTSLVREQDETKFMPIENLHFNINLKKDDSSSSSMFPFYANHIKVVNNLYNGFDIYCPSSGDLDKRSYWSLIVKYYKFPQNYLLNKSLGYSLLIPPYGINLLEAVQKNGLDKELSSFFDEYGLKLMLDKTNNTLRVMKLLKEDNAIVSFPYGSIADTLQRVIFFKTAIASNKDSIILFEEPEAHCFPPYIRYITQEIIESESNQFFIATHSPYVLDDFLKYQRDDVAIFMADFRDGQTVIKRLTDNQVNDVYEYGIDLFFNSELFTDEI
jgi:AAA15 family ATPase/GTPase